MTKFQRSKHKQLVEKLKRRKVANEPNLTIRNGVIIIKVLCRGGQRSNSQLTSNSHHQCSDTNN